MSGPHIHIRRRTPGVEQRGTASREQRGTASYDDRASLGPSHAGEQPPAVQMTFEQPTPTIAMSREHYQRIEGKIRSGMDTSSKMSTWLGFAMMVGGIAATLWVAILTATVATTPDTKGKLEVAAWVAVALFIALLVMHFVKRSQQLALGEDIIKEMDTYSYHAVEP